MDKRLWLTGLICIVAFGSSAMAVPLGGGYLSLPSNTSGIDWFGNDVWSAGANGSFSLECWFNPAAGGDGWILNAGESNDIRMFGGGGLIWQVYAGGFMNLISSSKPTVGAWNHVVGVFDDANDLTRLYLNGVEAAGSPLTGVTGTRTGILRGIGTIGSRQAPVGGLLVDEVACYTSALSAANVTARYNGGAGLAASGAGFNLDVQMVDPTYGDVTPRIQGGLARLYGGAAIIPEPATLALLAVGGLLGIRRRH